MGMYRVYCDVMDEWGCVTPARVGRTYGDVAKAAASARKASLRYKSAELRDDSRTIYDRILAVFREGREVQSRM